MSHTIQRLASAAAPLAVLMAVPAAASERSDDGERELAQLLEGRVAGAPVTCIRNGSSDAVRIVDGTAMVFRRGDTIYVNRPDGVQVLDNWDLPVFEMRGGNGLCRFDHVTLYNRGAQIPGPTLFLAEFVPYTRPAR